MRIIDSIKEPGSAITHAIGFLMTAAGAVPLLARSARREGNATLYCMLVFILSIFFKISPIVFVLFCAAAGILFTRLGVRGK